MHGGLFAPGGTVCSIKSPKKCIGSESFNRLSISLSASDYCQKTWSAPNASASDFISVVLIRTLPGAQADSFYHDFISFVLLDGVWFFLLNWIQLKIISGTAFHIIGLTKIPKIFPIGSTVQVLLE